MSDPSRQSAILDALSGHAQCRPDAVAYRESSGRSLTWRDLRRAVTGFAARLLAIDAAPVVAISSPNRLELPVALLGALRAGAEILPLAPDLPVAQIADLLGRTHTSISIGGPEVLTAAAAAGCRKGIALDRLLAEAPETGEPPPAPGGALLLTTSGTTGTPKIVRRRLAALDAVATSCARAIGVCADDRLLLTIPLHHSYGIDQGLLTAVFAGCTVELRDGFELSSVRAALQDGVTVLPAVPFLFDVLVRSEGASTWPGRSLRLAISAGGPLPRSVFDEFLAVSGVAIGQLYGATEFGSITWSDPARAGFAPQSVGTPLPGVQIRVLAEDDTLAERPLPVGCEGRVAIASPSLFAGYLDGSTLHPGSFYRTADLGRFDASGNLEITGRISLLIDVGGRKVNPIEIEALLEAHPDVSAAVVVPIPYSRTVSRLKAFVVPSGRSEIRSSELRAYLEERVPSYKIPRVFEVRDALPRSPTGKLLRRALTEERMYAAGRASSADG